MTITDHGVRTHHKYGMSKLNYLAACPGFTSKPGTNRAAEEGTRLHEIMDKLVAGFWNGYGPRATLEQYFDSVLANLTLSDDEEFYARYCCKEFDFWLKWVPVKLAQEEQVAILNPDGSELNSGYYDLAVFLSERSAVMFDWKFGWIPVPPAEGNLQGMGYALAMFQKCPRLEKIGFIFAQPKLHRTTRCSYSREQLPEMYARVREVVRQAENPTKQLRPGNQCDHCAVASTCTALINDASRAVAIHEGMAMPATFTGLQINTAEDAAKALYVLQRLEVLIDASGLKDKAKEFARLNDGKIECEIAPGRRVVVELREKNASRSANSPVLIAEALAGQLTLEQVLGACEPKITLLEDIFADEYVKRGDAEADRCIQDAEQTISDQQLDAKAAKALRATAKESAKAVRVTKKRAIEILDSTLRAEGLVTSPEGKVQYLKTRVEETPKQIQNQN